MLRTTNRKVIEKLNNHVLEEFKEHDTSKGAIDNLISQIDYMRYNNRSVYQTALDYVEGGSLLIYYGEQREFLAELLDETPVEAMQYSDDKVFKLYCHLVARTISKLYEMGTK
jgi:hypothetical protein